MAERRACPFQEPALAPRAAQHVGADDAHAVGAHRPQTLAEALETAKCAVRGVAVQPVRLAEPRGEAHHLAQPVQDHELAVRMTRDDHVKAVRTEVDGREHIRHDATAAHLDRRHSQAENEDPQPQVVLAFGLRMTNWAPCKSSL